MRTISRKNILSRKIMRTTTTPYGYVCKFCGQGGTAHMESVLTKRNEHIWFHRDCFYKAYNLKAEVNGNDYT